MALKLNSSGGGSVTLDSASTASNVTITIPATDAGSLVTANSSGNVGIGTSSPVSQLTVGSLPVTESGSTSYGAALVRGVDYTLSNTRRGILDIEMNQTGAQNSGATLTFTHNVSQFGQGVNYVGAGIKAAKENATNTNQSTYLAFSTNGSATLAERMRLDSAGNLGLGVTPSAWGSNHKAIQGLGASTFHIASYNTSLSIGTNYYSNNTNSIYVFTGLNSARYDITSAGIHRWYTAPSGTAGDPITFTQAMTLDASGNLVVGGTGAINTASGRGNITINGSSSSILSLTTGGANKAYIFCDGTNLDINNQANGYLTFQTNATERLRIDASGNVTPGVTNTQTLGAVGDVWSNVHATTFTGTTGTFTGDIQATSYNGGHLAGMRNKIINGNMGIFQRGVAAVTTNVYGPADRWKNDAVGSTFSTTQGSFVSGDTLFDTGGAQYFTQVAVTSVAGAANYVKLGQPIEDVRILAGQTVTVSFWAKAASGTPSIGVEVWQAFGTGGSPSAAVTGVGQAQALTTTWAKYSTTFTIPSINGKTLGTTANTSSTVVDFWLDSGSSSATRSGSIGQSSKTVSIAQVQLEIGSVATPFEQRPIGTELALCQRYYYRNTPGVTGIRFGAGYNQTTLINQTLINFPVPMRTTPGAVEQSGTAAHYSIANLGVTNACSAVPTSSAVNPYNAILLFTTATAMTAGQGSMGVAANVAAYIGFSAEL